MSKKLKFSSVKEIQEMALKHEKLRDIMRIERKNLDFESTESIQEYIDNCFEIFVYDGTLKINDNFYMIDEGGIYFINGDLIVNGYIQGFGATKFYVNGSIIANQILFEDMYIEKDVIVDEAYFVDTHLNLTINGELKTKFIYSSLNSGNININLIDTNIKGIIVVDSYDEIGDRKILEDLNLKEIIEDDEYEWHLTV